MVIRSFRFRKHPSGFVTTQEAGQFRQLAEFGYKMAYLSTQEHSDMQGDGNARGKLKVANIREWRNHALRACGS
jgi:hypothetical protein